MFLASSLTKCFLISFFLLILSLSSFNNVHSQNVLSDLDSIPFAQTNRYWARLFITSVFCADLDGDLDLDLAFPSYYDDSISILKNNGDGTFYPYRSYPAGDCPISIYGADLDGDIDLDLVLVDCQKYRVSILKNNGDGTFQNKVDYATSYYPSSVFCADLDGDKDLDLAVTDYDGSCVSIFKNNGDGTFQPKIDYNVGASPYSIFCTDLDGDTDIDLATANLRNDNISVLKNNGDGTFQNGVSYSAGNEPISIYSSDLDGDLDMDLVVANLGGNSISILKNNGDGTFQSKIDYTTWGPPWSVFSMDLDQDFDKDIAVANGNKNVCIFENNGDGTFRPAVRYDIGTGYPSSPRSLFCADLDGDSDLDLVVVDHNSVFVYILKNLTINLSRFYPLDKDSVTNPMNLSWQALTNSSPGDTVRYDLYLSRSIVFNPDSTLVYTSLLDTTFSDTLDLKTWYWKVKAYNQSGLVRYSDPGFSFYVYPKGDCNGNGEVDVSDAVYLISFLFKGGLAPIPFRSGDVNCDSRVSVADVVYLVNYLFKAGSPPC